MGKDNRPFGQCPFWYKIQHIVLLKTALVYIKGTVPKITPPMPTIASVSQATAGVKRLTVGTWEWDNADTGRTLRRFTVKVERVASATKFGLGQSRRSGVPRE